MKPGPREYPDAPRVAVGTVVIKDRAVLLVRRAHPPNAGVWAIPGGRIELGESLQAAAERELLEETGVRVRAREPLYTFDSVVRDESGRVRYHYIVVDLLAEYVSGTPVAADDALEARWVESGELDHLQVSTQTLSLLRSTLVNT